jgi:hypothetical protein
MIYLRVELVSSCLVYTSLVGRSLESSGMFREALLYMYLEVDGAIGEL